MKQKKNKDHENHLTIPETTVPETKCIIANLEKLKKEKNITYVQIAIDIDFPTQEIIRLKNNHRYGTIELRNRLINFYKVSEDYFNPTIKQIKDFAEEYKNIKLQKRISAKKADKDKRHFIKIEQNLIEEFENKRKNEIYNIFKKRSSNGFVILKNLLPYISKRGLTPVNLNQATNIAIDDLLLYQEQNNCPLQDAIKIYNHLARLNTKLQPETLLEYSPLTINIPDKEFFEIQDYAFFLYKNSQKTAFTTPPYTLEYSWVRALCAYLYFEFTPVPVTLLQRTTSSIYNSIENFEYNFLNNTREK